MTSFYFKVSFKAAILNFPRPHLPKCLRKSTSILNAHANSKTLSLPNHTEWLILETNNVK